MPLSQEHYQHLTTNQGHRLAQLVKEYQHINKAYAGLYALSHAALSEFMSWRKSRTADDDQANFQGETEWNLMEDRAKFLLQELADLKDPFHQKHREEESMRDAMEFGRHMREWRLAQKWSLEAMAKILHWTPHDVVAMELGIRKPDTNRLEVIQELLS